MQGLHFGEVVRQSLENRPSIQLLPGVVEQLSAPIEVNSIFGFVEEGWVIEIVVRVVGVQTHIFVPVVKFLLRVVDSVVNWEHVRLGCREVDI